MLFYFSNYLFRTQEEARILAEQKKREAALAAEQKKKEGELYQSMRELRIQV